MAADALKPGKKITLKRTDNCEEFDYIILKQLGKKDTGRIGAVKAVYIAEKRAPGSSFEESQTIVLKEFFPQNAENGIFAQDVTRNDDGSVSFSNKDVIDSLRLDFKREAGKLQEYKADPEMETQICAPKDVCILEGNGTLYIENEFHDNAASWKELKDINKLKADEILLTAIHSFRFLRKMHMHKDALVDFKPADVLIGYDPVHNEYGLSQPMFYDLDSVLTIDHEYKRSEIKCTKEYAPGSFSKGETALVSNVTERVTFIKVCRDMLNGCKECVSETVWNNLMSFLDSNDKENGGCSEDDTEKELDNLREDIQMDEYKFKSSKLPKKEIIFKIIQIISLILVLGLYSAMGLLLSYLCINADAVRGFIEAHGISEVFIAAVLTAGTVAVFGLRLFIDWMSERIARLHTSVYYFDRKDHAGNPIRNGEFNTFRYGWRKSTTFQDLSEHNRKRQRHRLILWFSLFFAIVAGLVLSIVFNAFPIFFAVGCAAIIVFMYVEYLPSAKDFFYSCHYPNVKKKYPSIKLQEANFFKKEYKDSQADGKNGPFELDSEYYEKSCRNLLKIRKTVKEKVASDPEFDLGYNSFQMKHIYKMTFDRLRNTQLIVNLSVLVVMLTTVFIDFMGFTGKLETYFRIPQQAYIYVTLILVTLVTVVSIFQLLISRRYERTVADVSYKSRYVTSVCMNELLVEDVAKGVVENIDIARGINQAEAGINTLNDGYLRKGLQRNYNFKNRRMVHHEVLANQRRLTIAVWLSFVSLASVFVWLCKIYWLFPVLLIVAAVINIAGNRYFLELIERKRIISAIHELEAFDEKNKAK